MLKTTLIFTVIGSLAFAIAAESASAQKLEGVELQKLVKITSDMDNDSVQMNAIIENGELAGVVHSADAEPVWLKDIERPSGVVILEKDGYSVLKLQGMLSRETQEGKLKISFLNNGLTKRYRACDFMVKKNGETWQLRNAYNNKPLREVKLITSSMGVKTIQGLCPSRE